PDLERLDPPRVPRRLEGRPVQVLDQDQRDVTPARGELQAMVLGRIGGGAMRANDDHADVRQIAERLGEPGPRVHPTEPGQEGLVGGRGEDAGDLPSGYGELPEAARDRKAGPRAAG